MVKKILFFLQWKLKNEIQKTDDDLSKWVNTLTFFKLPDESVQTSLRKIMKKISSTSG